MRFPNCRAAPTMRQQPQQHELATISARTQRRAACDPTRAQRVERCDRTRLLPPAPVRVRHRARHRAAHRAAELALFRSWPRQLFTVVGVDAGVRHRRARCSGRSCLPRFASLPGAMAHRLPGSGGAGPSLHRRSRSCSSSSRAPAGRQAPRSCSRTTAATRTIVDLRPSRSATRRSSSLSSRSCRWRCSSSSASTSTGGASSSCRAGSEELRELAVSAQLAALRAQVNPHFLFNSLNSIAQLIATDPAKAEACVERLGEIYRYLLHRAHAEFVPLADELQRRRGVPGDRAGALRRQPRGRGADRRARPRDCCCRA